MTFSDHYHMSIAMAHTGLLGGEIPSGQRWFHGWDGRHAPWNYATVKDGNFLNVNRACPPFFTLIQLFYFPNQPRQSFPHPPEQYFIPPASHGRNTFSHLFKNYFIFPTSQGRAFHTLSKNIYSSSQPGQKYFWHLQKILNSFGQSGESFSNPLMEYFLPSASQGRKTFHTSKKY